MGVTAITRPPLSSARPRRPSRDFLPGSPPSQLDGGGIDAPPSPAAAKPNAALPRPPSLLSHQRSSSNPQSGPGVPHPPRPHPGSAGGAAAPPPLPPPAPPFAPLRTVEVEVPKEEPPHRRTASNPLTLTLDRRLSSSASSSDEIPRPRGLKAHQRSSSGPTPSQRDQSSLIASRPPRIRRASSTNSVGRGGGNIGQRSRASSAGSYSSLLEGRTESQEEEESPEELVAELREKQQTLGWCHKEVGVLRNRLGNCHLRRGELREAEACYAEALRVFRSLCDEMKDDRHILANRRVRAAAALGNLGAVLWRTGRTEGAIPMLEEALEFHTSACTVFGDDPEKSLDVASILYSLGIARCLIGDHTGALADLSRSHRILLAVHGPGHLEVARTLDALGTVHRLRSGPDDASTALACHWDALGIKSSALGSSRHPAALRSQLGIAAAHHALGELEDALDMYRKIVKAQRSTLRRATGAEESSEKGRVGRKRMEAAKDLAVTLRHLGELWRNLGDHDGAVSALAEATVLLREVGVAEDGNSRPADSDRLATLNLELRTIVAEQHEGRGSD